MKVTLPSSQSHPLVRVTVKSPKGHTSTTLDDTHSTLKVTIPKGTREEQIEITAQLCDARGEPDERMEPIVLKAVSETPANEPAKQPAKPKPVEKSTDKPASAPKSNAPQS